MVEKWDRELGTGKTQQIALHERPSSIEIEWPRTVVSFWPTIAMVKQLPSPTKPWSIVLQVVAVSYSQPWPGHGRMIAGSIMPSHLFEVWRITPPSVLSCGTAYGKVEVMHRAPNIIYGPFTFHWLHFWEKNRTVCPQPPKYSPVSFRHKMK